MIVKIIITLLILFSTSSAFALNLADIPFDAATFQYWYILKSERYKQLEEESNLARDKSIALSDGQPKLAAFYAGVSGCLTSGCRSRFLIPDWNIRLEKIKKWLKSNPDSKSARIALATYYLEYGWAERGQGFSNSVKPQALETFRKNVERAKIELIKIEKIGKSDPGWYTSMLRVARSQGWSQKKFSDLYNEAINKFPQYIPLYFEMATYLSPRWYGSISELRTYIDEITKETYSFMGDTLYARLNWLMSTESMFQDGQTSWKRMKIGFDRIITDYPHRWNINNYAKFACLAGDTETFTRLNKKINGNPVIAAFWGSRKNYDICVSRLARN